MALKDLTNKELEALCDAHDVAYRAQSNKDTLVEALEAAGVAEPAPLGDAKIDVDEATAELLGVPVGEYSQEAYTKLTEAAGVTSDELAELIDRAKSEGYANGKADEVASQGAPIEIAGVVPGGAWECGACGRTHAAGQYEHCQNPKCGRPAIFPEGYPEDVLAELPQYPDNEADSGDE